MIVVVAHPSPPVATGMAAALGRDVGVSTASVTTVQELWERIARDKPDLVVVDVLLTPGQAPELSGQLARRQVKAIMLTRTDGAVPFFSLLQSGAAGIALAGDGVAGLTAAVRTVMEGHTHVPSHLLGSVLHEMIVDRRDQQPAPAPRIDNLSPREREVLALLGHGADTREIATHLVISPHTAKTHINRLLGKLGLSSRTEAAAYAITHGIRSSLLEPTHD